MVRLISLLILVTLLACEKRSASEVTDTSTIIDDGDLKVIESPNFTISFPKDWTADLNKNMGTSFLLFAPAEEGANFRDNINLLIQKLPDAGYDLNKYVDVSLQQMSTGLSNNNLLESKRMKANAEEYHLLIFTGEQNSRKLKWKQIYRIEGDQAYVLTFTASQEGYDRQLETADKILESFRLK
jgi:hypothetical protein